MVRCEMIVAATPPMKKFAVLLALSLAANVAFVITYFIRTQVAARTPTTQAVSTANAIPSVARLDSTQLLALRSDDAAHLKAMGFPEEVIQSLMVGRAFTKLQARMNALRTAPESEGRYWRSSSSSAFLNRSKEQRLEMAKANREFSDALRAVFGDQASTFGGMESRYAFLPAAKREQLRQIDQDYGEMQSEVYMEMNGVQLASDREKLKLLQAEKARDLAAVLTTEEFEEYQLRVSPTAMNLRSRYGDAIQTEEDYKRIFALQKAFDDKYSLRNFRMSGPMSPETMRERADAERALAESIRSAIGEENYAAFQRANDQSYKALTSLVKRLSLPETTISAVLASRDSYAIQSQQINQNTALSADQRRSQLQALATKARGELSATFGAEGAEALAQRSDWLQMLSNGAAFSTDANAAPPGMQLGSRSVYPVAPPRPVPKPAPPKT